MRPVLTLGIRRKENCHDVVFAMPQLEKLQVQEDCSIPLIVMPPSGLPDTVEL
jgi:hypothetical protein